MYGLCRREACPSRQCTRSRTHSTPGHRQGWTFLIETEDIIWHGEARAFMYRNHLIDLTRSISSHFHSFCSVHWKTWTQVFFFYSISIFILVTPIFFYFFFCSHLFVFLFLLMTYVKLNMPML